MFVQGFLECRGEGNGFRQHLSTGMRWKSVVWKQTSATSNLGLEKQGKPLTGKRSTRPPSGVKSTTHWE